MFSWFTDGRIRLLHESPEPPAAAVDAAAEDPGEAISDAIGDAIASTQTRGRRASGVALPEAPAEAEPQVEPEGPTDPAAPALAEPPATGFDPSVPIEVDGVTYDNMDAVLAELAAAKARIEHTRKWVGQGGPGSQGAIPAPEWLDVPEPTPEPIVPLFNTGAMGNPTDANEFVAMFTSSPAGPKQAADWMDANPGKVPEELWNHCMGLYYQADAGAAMAFNNARQQAQLQATLSSFRDDEVVPRLNPLIQSDVNARAERITQMMVERIPEYPQYQARIEAAVKSYPPGTFITAEMVGDPEAVCEKLTQLYDHFWGRDQRLLRAQQAQAAVAGTPPPAEVQPVNGQTQAPTAEQIRRAAAAAAQNQSRSLGGSGQIATSAAATGGSLTDDAIADAIALAEPIRGSGQRG